MKHLFFVKKGILAILCFLLNIPVWAQQDIRIPPSKDLVKYKLTNKAIYRDGWVDFNKNGKMDIYEDPSAPIDDRIEDLLSQMNLNEKTCQMVTLYGYKRVLQDELPTSAWKNKLWKDGIGAIDEHLNSFQQWGLPPSDNPFVWPASRHAWALNEVQRFFVEETRLGIPVDMTNEGIRGVESYKATNFPTQLGLGHTWNRELVGKIGYITGREGRLLGYTNIYAPILDVGRDQRWGRYEEVYGESPFLVAELGIVMVQGMQKDYQVAATGKHYVAYSNNKGGREGMSRVDPQMSPREVEYVHVYPWARVIKEGKLLGVMSAYNDYDGFPIQSSNYWLTTRLRKEMGFKGYVVSDSDAVEYLHSKHKTSHNMKESVLQAVEAGLNVRCTFRSPDSYVLPLRELVDEGAISMETIDSRVRDILRVKFMVGLFDMPYQKDLAAADKEVNSPENQKVALQASRESIVFLKNIKNTLPLNLDSIKTISVTGPNADDARYALAHYGPQAVEVTTVLEGIKAKMKNKGEVLYTKGCDIVDANWPESEIFPSPLTVSEQQEIDKAVINAQKSDVCIIVLGGSQRTCGENKSRSSIDLPGHQQKLLEAVYATGKPIVLVMINGRPNSINWAEKYIPAILETWYPGSQGGTAVADVLFGDYNPGGKLTVTIPKSVGQIPFNFPAKPASQVDGGKGVGMDGKMSRLNGALYPFGYGLSYTTFEYSDLEISSRLITPNQDVTITCNVTNTGKVAGDEVVQLYVRDLISSVTTYEKNLRGFERVQLKSGETKKVSFVIRPRDLQLLDKKNEWIIEPGDFAIMIGASSEDIRLNGTLTVKDYNQIVVRKSGKEETGAYRLVIDGDENMGWTGAKGDYITLPMKEGATPSEIKILWQNIETSTAFEIQASSGGGQFLTVYSGNVIPSNEYITYPLKGDIVSDVRIVMTSGKGTIAEVILNGVEK